MRNMIAEIRDLLNERAIGSQEIHQLQESVMNALPIMVSKLAGRDYEPGRYMLYKDPDFGFVIMMLVWNQGQATPIHAHGTWGIEAVIKNKVRVTSYACDEMQAREVGSVVLPTGAVAYVLPPDADIHKVEHFGDGQAITVHIYGKELIENQVFFPGEGFKGVKCVTKETPSDLEWFMPVGSVDQTWPTA